MKRKYAFDILKIAKPKLNRESAGGIMVNIYLTRHGKTMFNTIGRAQGWSDTPLTKEGEQGIIELGLGLHKAGVVFDRAYSSDSGRTIQTMNLALKYSKNEGIPYKMDARIREWCFGSFDGGYDGELFNGVLPRIFTENGVVGKMPSYEEIAKAIVQVDTAGWAEPWEKLSGRLLEGFSEIARESEDAGVKNIIVVSHSMAITTFLYLLAPNENIPHSLDNGSVTHLVYEKDGFTIGEVGDMSYRLSGRQVLRNEQ